MPDRRDARCLTGGEALYYKTKIWSTLVQERGLCRQTVRLTDKRGDGRKRRKRVLGQMREGELRDADPPRIKDREGNYLLRVAGVCLKAEFKGRLTPTG